MIFTLFDIIIFASIITSTMLGFYRGAIAITINLIGFFVSIVAAVFLYSYAQEFVGGYIENALINSIVSGVSSYLVSLAVFTFVASKIIFLLTPISRGIFDRITGLLIGIIRGAIFAILLFAAIAIFTSKTYSESQVFEDMVLKLSDEKYEDWLKQSQTTPYLEESLKAFVKYLPKSASQYPMPNANNGKKEEDAVIDTIEESKKDVADLISEKLNE